MNNIKISNIYSPQSVKTTNNFKLELFNTFIAVPDYSFDNLILSIEAPIPMTEFTSGIMADDTGTFSSSLPFI